MFGYANFGSRSVPYDLTFYLSGKPAEAEILYRHIAARNFIILVNMAGSVAKADVAATAETVISCKKNGTQFGTITFAAASSVGTFAAASQTVFAAGDVLSLHAPATQDATLRDLMLTLTGTRS